MDEVDISPVISIITATRNAERPLRRLIESVREQNYSNYEWIVIDAASPDGTQELLANSSDVVDFWVSEPDQGIYEAWNKALQHVHGEWVCFLGADDYFAGPDSLLSIVDILRSTSTKYSVVYSRIAVVDDMDNIIYELGSPWSTLKRIFNQTMCIPHPGLMHHRRLFEQYGVFDTAYRIAGDYEFLLRHLKNNDALFNSGPALIKMSYGGVSSNPQNSWLQLMEVRRAQIKNAFYCPGRYWIFAFFRVLTRRLLWKICGERMARIILDYGRLLLGRPAHWTKLR